MTIVRARNQIITIPPPALSGASLAGSNLVGASREIIAAPDADTARHTMLQGPDGGWDIHIRKDGDGIKVHRPLQRDLGFGRESRPPAPPPEITGYQFREETTKGYVSTLLYAAQLISSTSDETPPILTTDTNADAWANRFPFGSTNTLARTLASYPPQSLESVMYTHAQAVGAIMEIAPDGQLSQLGTGFLAVSPYVGDTHIYLVTNQHVISAGDSGGRQELWLGYENPNGTPKERIAIHGHPARNTKLNYAIFRIKDGDKTETIESHSLKSHPFGSASIGDRIYMPNHANGGVKGISYRDSSGRNTKILQVTSDLGEEYRGQVLLHNAFNTPGTSGSPIIDSRSHSVVALNFGGIGQGRAVNMSAVWADAWPQLRHGT